MTLSQEPALVAEPLDVTIVEDAIVVEGEGGARCMTAAAAAATAERVLAAVGRLRERRLLESVRILFD